MAYRSKKLHSYALMRPFVPRPITHANLTGRREPNPIETTFVRPSGRPRGGALHQLRLAGVVSMPIGLGTCVVSAFTLRPIAFVVGVALLAFGRLLVRFTHHRLR